MQKYPFDVMHCVINFLYFNSKLIKIIIYINKYRTEQFHNETSAQTYLKLPIGKIIIHEI